MFVVLLEFPIWLLLCAFNFAFASIKNDIVVKENICHLDFSLYESRGLKQSAGVLLV